MKILIRVRALRILTSIIILECIFSSCTYNSKRKLQVNKPEVKYKTTFPSTNSSAELENILHSVKKITNYSSYRTYVFDENAHMTINDLSSEGLLEHARAGIVTSEATAGTALIIFSDGKHVALLTCAHAVKAPDTIIQWDEYSDLGNNRYIHSISLKLRQQLYVRDMPDGTKFSVLASDTKNDIAIIGSAYNDVVNDIPVFTNACGNSAELRWGSFLYLAGYPTGQQMVAHGIVSQLPENAGSFLSDAPFNEGFSGGIALAVTEADDKFELVGMARSVAATYGYVLKPEKENHEFNYNPAIPYTGNIYVNQKKDINYGVTSVISINQIRKFYDVNQISLKTAGYNLDEFFGLIKKE